MIIERNHSACKMSRLPAPSHARTLAGRYRKKIERGILSWFNTSGCVLSLESLDITQTRYTKKLLQAQLLSNGWTSGGIVIKESRTHTRARTHARNSQTRGQGFKFPQAPKLVQYPPLNTNDIDGMIFFFVFQSLNINIF